MLHLVDDLMAIGEFSDRSGISAKRLRTYAAEGLLAPAAVDPSSGYRYYSPGQLPDAQVIDALRQAGVALAEIGVFMCHPSPRPDRPLGKTAPSCREGPPRCPHSRPPTDHCE